MTDEQNGTDTATEPARRGRPKGATKAPRQRPNVATELAAMKTAATIACNLLKCVEAADGTANAKLIGAAVNILEGNQP